MRCAQPCVISAQSPHLEGSHLIVMVLLRYSLCVKCESQRGESNRRSDKPQPYLTLLSGAPAVIEL